MILRWSDIHFFTSCPFSHSFFCFLSPSSDLSDFLNLRRNVKGRGERAKVKGRPSEKEGSLERQGHLCQAARSVLPLFTTSPRLDRLTPPHLGTLGLLKIQRQPVCDAYGLVGASWDFLAVLTGPHFSCSNWKLAWPWHFSQLRTWKATLFLKVYVPILV